MKHVLLSLSFFLSTMIYAQKVNDFQYVIVPNKYDAMKTADQYQVNGLSKFLLNKYGFDAYLESDDKPFAMKDAACKALYADIVDDSNFIQTRVYFILKDCEGETIFKTTQGRSKKKEYKQAYQEALRAAFIDIKELKYSYNGDTSDEEQTTSTTIATSNKEVKPTERKEKMEVVDKLDKGDKTRPVLTIESEPTNSTNDRVLDLPVDSDSSIPVLYTSEDGFYRAVSFGDSITFYQGDKNIGVASGIHEDIFSVKTQQFDGSGYFKEGRLIVARKIKGVVGDVQMIFTKQ